MLIAECKKHKILPTKGALVKVVDKYVDNFPDVDIKYLRDRTTGLGRYMDFVAGTSGDFWWILNEDATVGIYSCDEVSDP